jgi:hypothetical protein
MKTSRLGGVESAEWLLVCVAECTNGNRGIPPLLASTLVATERQLNSQLK